MTALEMLRGECVGSLLLSDECAAVEVRVYFCRLSFQGPDWQLFLEPESHSLVKRTSIGGKGGKEHSLIPTHTYTDTHAYTLTMWRRAYTHMFTFLMGKLDVCDKHTPEHTCTNCTVAHK